MSYVQGINVCYHATSPIRILNPCCLSYIASYDVASSISIWQYLALLVSGTWHWHVACGTWHEVISITDVGSNER